MLSNSQIIEWLEQSRTPTKKTKDGRKMEYHLARTAVPALCEELLSAPTPEEIAKDAYVSGHSKYETVLRELGRLRVHMVEYNTEYDRETRSKFVEIIDKFMDRI